MNTVLPKRLPNFMRPTYLNGFAFSIEGGNEEYEYFNGKFYKRVATIRPGISFGEQAVHKRTMQQIAIKADTPIEFATLTSEDYEKSLRSISDKV